MEALLAKKLVISADRNTLMDQVAEFEPIYKEIMSKEHYIIMVLNRGKDVMTRSSKANASNIKKNLDAVEKSWQKVKKISQERQTRLNTCIKKLQDNKDFIGKLDPYVKIIFNKQEFQSKKVRNNLYKTG